MRCRGTIPQRLLRISPQMRPQSTPASRSSRTIGSKQLLRQIFGGVSRFLKLFHEMQGPVQVVSRSHGRQDVPFAVQHLGVEPLEHLIEPKTCKKSGPIRQEAHLPAPALHPQAPFQHPSAHPRPPPGHPRRLWGHGPGDAPRM